MGEQVGPLYNIRAVLLHAFLMRRKYKEKINFRMTFKRASYTYTFIIFVIQDEIYLI